MEKYVLNLFMKQKKFILVLTLFKRHQVKVCNIWHKVVSVLYQSGRCDKIVTNLHLTYSK